MDPVCVYNRSRPPTLGPHMRLSAGTLAMLKKEIGFPLWSSRAEDASSFNFYSFSYDGTGGRFLLGRRWGQCPSCALWAGPLLAPLGCQQVGNCGCFEFLYILFSGSTCSLVYAVGDEMQPTKPFVEGVICISPDCGYHVMFLLWLLLPRGNPHL